MRYVAFPSAFSRMPLELECTTSQHGNWTIVIGPTESGLYILEATREVIEVMKRLYDLQGRKPPALCWWMNAHQ